jgi:hypothetical protein
MATLSPDQWQALSPYLDEALAMTEKERSLWLSSLRSQNQEIAEQLEMLFREHRALSEEGFLEKSSPACHEVQAYRVKLLVPTLGPTNTPKSFAPVSRRVRNEPRPPWLVLPLIAKKRDEWGTPRGGERTEQRFIT